MELFKIFGSILIEDKDALKSLKSTQQESYKVDKALNQIGDAGKKIGKAVAVGALAVGTSMIAITKKTVSTLDDIDKASQRAGMGAEEFQRWGHVASLNGIEMATFEKAAIRNQRAMAQASQGAGKAAESYEKLGINIEGMNSDQVFEEVILGLSEIENETERNAIANDLFGKSFADLAPLLNNNSSDIKNMKGELDDLGAVMSQDQVSAGAALNDTMDRIGRMFGALALNIGNELIPKFEAIGQWILDNKEPIQEGFKTVFDAIGKAISFVMDQADWLIPVLAGVLGAILAFKVVAGISALFAAFTTILAGVSAAGGVLNLVMAANPLGLIAVAIGVVIAAGVLLWKNWDKVSEVASNLWQSLKNTFDNIKDKISGVMESAKNIVSNAVNKIKSIFTFKWEFPKLKMPKFSVKGSANPLRWLKEGTPKLAVDWFAKGGLMTTATIFGASGDRLLGGGEAGTEAILPLTDSVLGAIGKGIANTMGHGDTSNITILDLRKLLNNLVFTIEDGGDTFKSIVDDRLLEVM